MWMGFGGFGASSSSSLFFSVRSVSMPWLKTITSVLPAAFHCCAPGAERLSSFLSPGLGFLTAFNQEREQSRKVSPLFLFSTSKI